MITVKQLAKILGEEFDRDMWGDIDPFLFRHVSDEVDIDDTEQDDNDEDALALRRVLERVVERLGEQT